jgi:hypothetical protein
MLTRSRHATITVFIGAILALSSLAAHAQKPALTQNIDEKGRVPYQAGTNVNCALNHDGPQICAIGFPVVPAGYRLVVTYISATFDEGVSAPSATVNLTGGALLPGGTTSLATGPVFVATLVGGSFVLSSPVTYYVEPGGNAALTVQNYSSFATGFVSGYLINLNQ